MLSYVAKRLLLAVPTLLAVLTVVFFFVRIAPGDPAFIILGDQASQQALAAVRHSLGLDQPIPVQYVAFLGQVLQGDLGASLVTNRRVWNEVVKVLPYTIDLTLTALAIGVALGLPLGIIAARSRNGAIDYVARFFSLLGLSFPAFVSAILLLLAFAIQVALVSGDQRRTSRRRGRAAAQLGPAGDQSRPDHGRLCHAGDPLQHAGRAR
jgi:peptide/nickel transport system permease protein